MMKCKLFLVMVVIISAGCSARRGVRGLDSPYGLCVHAPHSSPEQAKVDKMLDAGVDWIRIDFVWKWVEPHQDVFNWSEFDSIAKYVRSRSRPVHVLANLQIPPAWAVKPGGTGMLKDVADLKDILTRAVRRYQGVFDYWGLYNEPDCDRNWTRDEYINQILIPGADAIHAASPIAKVVGPELSHLTHPDMTDHEWWYWLRGAIEQAGDKIDIVSHHTYGSNWTLNNRLSSVRGVLNDAGWDGPVWLTETGRQSGSNPSGQAAWLSTFLGKVQTRVTACDRASWPRLHVCPCFLRHLRTGCPEKPSRKVLPWGISF